MYAAAQPSEMAFSGVETAAYDAFYAALAPGEVSGWAQEINFCGDKDRTETYGYRAEGFGVAGGYEKMTTRGGVVRASFAVTSSDLQNPGSEAEEVLSASLVELGLYWRAQGQDRATLARATAGYTTFNSVRTLVDESVRIENEADWDGFTLSAAAGASYERRLGRFNVSPEVYAEVFALRESAQTETGGPAAPRSTPATSRRNARASAECDRAGRKGMDYRATVRLPQFTLSATLSRPFALILTSGNVSDITVALALLARAPNARHVLADKGYVADALRRLCARPGLFPSSPAATTEGARCL